MHIVILLAAFCGLASCADPEPVRCCQDRQWTATLMGIGGRVYTQTSNAMSIDSETVMQYDYYRKRIHLDITFREADGTKKITRSILDYEKDRQYLFREDGHCTSAKIGSPIQEPCIPATSRFLGSAVLGFGAESFKINTWESAMPGTDLVIKRSYTDQGCVPFQEAFYGTSNGTPMNLVQIVTNFKPGLTDPALMELPLLLNCSFVDENGPVYGRR